MWGERAKTVHLLFFFSPVLFTKTKTASAAGIYGNFGKAIGSHHVTHTQHSKETDPISANTNRAGIAVKWIMDMDLETKDE